MTLKQKEIDEIQAKFNKERKAYMEDLNAINLKIVNERKRLKDEEQFFDKKMDILKSGFAQLEADRRAFDIERKAFNNERMSYSSSSGAFGCDDVVTEGLFAGVNNPLALKKRYRDLLKIFHPDNLCGDNTMVSIINKEYDRLKKELDYPFKSVK